MRLYLLPISTRRTLLYGQRLNEATTDKQTLVDRVQARAAKTWADWEKKEKGWQKTIVGYGNYALKRIPYEEWGLKSVPPLSKRRKADELQGKEKVEVVFPQTLIPADKVSGVLHTLSTERDALHRRRMMWCFIGMPITIPFALVPVIPNFPFFYLVYRAWSHWRAINGGKHIQFLLQNKLLTYKPSPILEQVYVKKTLALPSSPEPTSKSDTTPSPDPEHQDGETMLLSQENGRKMTEVLDIPQLEVELERAIWQVETAIEKKNEEMRQEAAKKSTGQAPPEDDKKIR